MYGALEVYSKSSLGAYLSAHGRWISGDGWMDVECWKIQFHHFRKSFFKIQSPPLTSWTTVYTDIPLPMYLIFPVVINPRYYEPPTYLSCHHISRWPGQPPVDPVLNQCARLISNGVWDTQATPVDRHGERWGICWNHVQTSLGSFIQSWIKATCTCWWPHWASIKNGGQRTMSKTEGR